MIFKFRAWDKDAEQMYVWESIKYEFYEHVEHHKIEVMQFTGLHDKNGKEVYEGDIIQSRHGQKGKVHYSSDGYLVTWIEENYDSHLRRVVVHGEVIGNIYEGVTE